MKGLIKFIIGLVVFAVFSCLVLLIVGIVLVNMTPNKLKIGDKTIINGKSCNDLGIGDVKIKTMIDDFNEIKSEKNVVVKPFNKEDAEAELTPIFTNFDLITDGELDFQKLYSTGLDASTGYYYEYSDTSIAYIINNSLSYMTGDAQTLTNFKFEVAEMSFFGNKKRIRIVYKVDISEFKQNLEKAIPSFVSRFIGMPKVVYLVSYYNVDVTSEGRLDLEYDGIFINDVDTPFANAILRSISTENNSIEEYGQSLGEAISEAVSYMGKIGTCTSSSGVITDPSSIVYGIGGFKEGKIGMICGI